MPLHRMPAAEVDVSLLARIGRRTVDAVLS
jgi:hypothetical protein